jgi:hypothetical protein
MAAMPTAIANPEGGGNIDVQCRLALAEPLVALRSQNVII